MSVVIQLLTNIFIFLHDYSHSEYIYTIYILYNLDGLYSNNSIFSSLVIPLSNHPVDESEILLVDSLGMSLAIFPIA